MGRPDQGERLGGGVNGVVIPGDARTLERRVSLVQIV
jgi:hypothetical protein